LSGSQRGGIEIVMAINYDRQLSFSCGKTEVMSFPAALQPRIRRAIGTKQEHTECPVMPHASGTFDVKTIPQPAEEQAGGEAIGRLWLDKKFQGELDAVSAGTMLGARSPVQGSAGYVAIERVSGTLNGAAGAFLLQHFGVMTRGAMEQTVVIIPDSGSDGLTGIAGKMTIAVENGVHRYRLDYTLP
jgi:hypothetical protein